MYSLAHLMQPSTDEATMVRMAPPMQTDSHQPMQILGHEATPPLPSKSTAAPGVYAVYSEDGSLQVPPSIAILEVICWPSTQYTPEPFTPILQYT